MFATSGSFVEKLPQSLSLRPSRLAERARRRREVVPRRRRKHEVSISSCFVTSEMASVTCSRRSETRLCDWTENCIQIKRHGNRNSGFTHISISGYSSVTIQTLVRWWRSIVASLEWTTQPRSVQIYTLCKRKDTLTLCRVYSFTVKVQHRAANVSLALD